LASRNAPSLSAFRLADVIFPDATNSFFRQDEPAKLGGKAESILLDADAREPRRQS